MSANTKAHLVVWPILLCALVGLANIALGIPDWIAVKFPDFGGFAKVAGAVVLVGGFMLIVAVGSFAFEGARNRFRSS